MTITTINGDGGCQWMSSYRDDIILPNELVRSSGNLSLNGPVNPSPISELGEIIAKKYGSRSLMSTDPAPIKISCDTTGPLNVAKGFIMCDTCGSIIRRNYLTNHRNSGACARLAEKRNLQIHEDTVIRQTEHFRQGNQKSNVSMYQSIQSNDFSLRGSNGPIPQSDYNGPYVHLSGSSDNITNISESTNQEK